MSSLWVSVRGIREKGTSKRKKEVRSIRKDTKRKEEIKQKDNYYNWYCTFITDTRWSDIFSYDC